MPKYLLIDDVRDPERFGATTVARTSNEAISALNRGGWDRVYFDNDMGTGQKEGWQIVTHMMYRVDPDKWPAEMAVVSDNPPARANIESKFGSMGYERTGKEDYGQVIWSRQEETLTIPSATGNVGTFKLSSEGSDKGPLQFIGQDHYGRRYYLMDVRKDTYIHFTTSKRAPEIVRSGKLMLDAPYSGMGAYGVFGVSTTFGKHYPGVSLSHVEEWAKEEGSEVVAIEFKTDTVPMKYGHADEVAWGEQDVKLIGPKVISQEEAVAKINASPHKLSNDYDEFVVYSKKPLDVMGFTPAPGANKVFSQTVPAAPTRVVQAYMKTSAYHDPSEVAGEAYNERYSQALEDAIDNIVQNKPPRKLMPLNTARMKKIWRDYARTGVVRDERGVDDILDDFLEKTVRIDVNNYLSGHTPGDPMEEFKDREIPIPKDIDDRLDVAIADINGRWMISDYGTDKLQAALFKAMTTTTDYEQKLLALDSMLNVVHQRSDLASWFVQGGRGALDAISQDKVASDLKPPASVSSQAAKGLEYRRRARGKGGLSTQQAKAEGIGSGVQRAVNLKNRDTLSPSTVKRMKAFFDRHRKNKSVSPENKDEPWKDRGHVAWLLWGGDPGYAWSKKTVEQMDYEKSASRVVKSFLYKTMPSSMSWAETGDVPLYKDPAPADTSEILKEDPNTTVRAAVNRQGDSYAWNGKIMHSTVEGYLHTKWSAVIEYDPHLFTATLYVNSGDKKDEEKYLHVTEGMFPKLHKIETASGDYTVDQGRYVLEPLMKGDAGPGRDFGITPASLAQQYHRTARVVEAYLKSAASPYYRVAGKDVYIKHGEVPDDVWERFSEAMKSFGFDWRGGEDAKRLIGRWQTTDGETLLDGAHAQGFLNAVGKIDMHKPKAGVNVARVLQAAKRKFGTTENLTAAGYIMPDGDLLNFGSGFGGRQEDHGAIGQVLPESMLPPNYSSYDAIKAFCSMGPVRVHLGPNAVSFDVYRRPTSDQLGRIEDVIVSEPNKPIVVQAGIRHEEFTPGDHELALEFIKKATSY